MSRTLRIITRKSPLARAQTDLVCNAIKKIEPDINIEIEAVMSDGCEERFDGDLKQEGGKGMFVKGLEKALLENKADIAVHSMKDVPTDEELPKGLEISAVLPRGDIRDVVICKEADSFAELKEGSRIGTCSPRRAAQIKAAFPGFKILPLRGNVDTRIQKMKDGEVDAIILAKSGLDRLGLSSEITDVLQPDLMCPSASQGIVGIECRQDDVNTKKILARINHEHTFMCLQAEREMLKILQGDCFTAVGAHCEVTLSGENLRMIAMVASIDGREIIWSRQKMAYGKHLEIGRATAEDLLAQGAEALIRPKAA